MTPLLPHMIHAAGEPSLIRLCAGGEKIELAAAEQGADGKPKLRTFSAVAYTGGMIRVDGFWNPIVIDLEGFKVARQDNPVLQNHDPSKIVGHTDGVTFNSKSVKATGVMSGVGDAAQEVLATASNGFPWQISVGASADSKEFVDAGASVKVNGKTFAGPIVVIRQSTLQELSFVPVGADQNTSANLAASRKGTPMDFDAWLAANYDGITFSAGQKAKLKATWQAEQTPPTPPANPPPAPIAEIKAATDTTFDQQMQAIEAENARIEYIRTASVRAMQSCLGNPVKCNQIKVMCEAAISDKKTDQRAYELALLRHDRSLTAQIVHVGREPALNEEVIEAAICQTHKVPGIEKQFSEQTLEAAHRHFKRGIGLKEMLLLAAERNNGYRGSIRDEAALCRAAFKIRNDDGRYIEASVGPSTISVPGILSSVANKILMNTWGFSEQEWRKIAKIVSVSDFKTYTTYRLGGAGKFEKLSPGGELKHGTLSETTYTISADTYGKLLGIDRRDLINDDLGAFASATAELARGGSDSLNEIFWTAFLDDSDFFNTDKSRGNYDDGATDSVLSLAGLENADGIFAAQTKPDGTPLGAMPTILLVPRTLRATANNLMNGVTTSLAQSTATLTTFNAFSGMYQVVSSLYLASSAISGYSSTAWYLLADPNNIAAIAVAFLNGVETPTVEQGEFDFDRLGLAMRAYLDVGVNKQEPKAGTKLKGAA